MYFLIFNKYFSYNVTHSSQILQIRSRAHRKRGQSAGSSSKLLHVDRISPRILAPVPEVGGGEGRTESDIAHADEDMEEDLEVPEPRRRLRLEGRCIKVQFSLC